MALSTTHNALQAHVNFIAFKLSLSRLVQSLALNDYVMKQTSYALYNRAKGWLFVRVPVLSAASRRRVDLSIADVSFLAH